MGRGGEGCVAAVEILRMRREQRLALARPRRALPGTRRSRSTAPAPAKPSLVVPSPVPTERLLAALVQRGRFCAGRGRQTGRERALAPPASGGTERRGRYARGNAAGGRGGGSGTGARRGSRGRGGRDGRGREGGDGGESGQRWCRALGCCFLGAVWWRWIWCPARLHEMGDCSAFLVSKSTTTGHALALSLIETTGGIRADVLKREARDEFGGHTHQNQQGPLLGSPPF
mgnify:FL=1